MDAIASTGFGIRVDSQKDRNNDFVKYASTAFDDFNPVKPMIILHGKCRHLKKASNMNIKFG